MAIIGALPNTINNGDPIDAVPVMGNLNWILSQVNGNALAIVNNLSDVANAAIALGNLGGLAIASNLSDVANPVTALSNLAGAPLASPALTGTPTAPTQAASDNSTKVATTAYADGAITTQHTADQALFSGIGQCYLSLSGGDLLLSPYNGNQIKINGTLETIPSAGVSLAPTGLLATTLYYVYAYMASGVMTLEASTTGHSTDASTGVEIKTGDATRTLVGAVYCPSAATFADSDTQRYMVSWFNPKEKPLRYTNSGTLTPTTTIAALSGTNVSFLTLTGRNSRVSADISIVGNTNGAIHYIGVGVDGVRKTLQTTTVYASASPTSGISSTYSDNTLSEGVHTAQIFAAISSGTGTVNAGYARIDGYIKG